MAAAMLLPPVKSRVVMMRVVPPPSCSRPESMTATVTPLPVSDWAVTAGLTGTATARPFLLLWDRPRQSGHRSTVSLAADAANPVVRIAGAPQARGRRSGVTDSPSLKTSAPKTT